MANKLTPPQRGTWATLKEGFPLIARGLSPESRASEDYRQIAVDIEENFVGRSKEPRILAITSPEPVSGKTLTSLNLALLLARRGERRVLLVEGDLWRPSMRRYLQVEDGLKGFSDILKNGSSVGDVVGSIWGAGLDFVLSGDAGEVSDLMTPEGLLQAGAELRSAYELIVVDCPPILVSGGRSLANWADKAVLVVRAGKTRRKSIEAALEFLGPDKTLGLVLNDLAEGHAQPAYYYHKHQSGAGRGSDTTGSA